MRVPNFTLRWIAVVASVLLANALWPAVGLGEIQFSGQATGVRATVFGQTIALSETEPLPNEGGAEHASLLDAEIPGVLTVGVLHASSVGQGDRSRSKASVADLDLMVGGNKVGASFLVARAEAVCGPLGPAVSGNSSLAELMINNQTIFVTGEPNQTIDLPLGGKVIINEQSQSISGNRGEITVTALHVIVPGVADIAIARSYADIVCAGQPDCVSSKDFVTGGGWITVGGSKATWAVAGGIKNGFWGHLNYNDHGARLKVKGTGVTKYEVTGATSRHIEGTCEIDGSPGTYKVDVADLGEPGRNDTFQIELSNGYSASGNLGGGNIQLHIQCK